MLLAPSPKHFGEPASADCRGTTTICAAGKMTKTVGTTCGRVGLAAPIAQDDAPICLLLRHSGTLLPTRMFILFAPSPRTTTRPIGKSSSLQPFSSLVRRTHSRNATRNHRSRCSTLFCNCSVTNTLVHDQRYKPAPTLYKSNIHIQE